MRSEREANRIVRSWLETGSTAVPERVIDAVLADLHVTPQRRPPWSARRLQGMNTVARLAAIAAVIAVAVAAAAGLVPRAPSVGSPSESGPPVGASFNAPSASPSASGATITGTVEYPFRGSERWTVAVDSSMAESSLRGSADVTGPAGSFRIALECVDLITDETWVLGGEIAESDSAERQAGTRAAVILRDDSPQKVALWYEDPPPAADCASFMENIPREMYSVPDPMVFSTVEEGNITLPPPPAPRASPSLQSPRSTATGGDCLLELTHNRSDRLMDYGVRGKGFKPNLANAPVVTFSENGRRFFELSDRDAAPEEQGTDEQGSFGGGFSLANESIPIDRGREWKAVATDGTCTAEVTFDPYEFR